MIPHSRKKKCTCGGHSYWDLKHRNKGRELDFKLGYLSEGYYKEDPFFKRMKRTVLEAIRLKGKAKKDKNW